MIKQFAIVGAFAVAGLVLPGSAVITAQAQTDQPKGRPTTLGGDQGRSGQTGTTGRTHEATAKSAGADTSFVKNAAEGGLAEVELGKLATEKASSAEVKQFGQHMVDQHTKANEQLQKVASQKGIDVPSELSAKDKATKSRLERLSGAAFDRAYMRDMVKDHTKDVSEFRKEAKSGSDADVKSFASEALPTLESHLNQARQIDSTLNGSESSRTSKSSHSRSGKKGESGK
jgi:putative membrane protein